MIEVEIKLPVKSIEEVKAVLLENGFHKDKHIREHDIYFDGERHIKDHGEALRIRETTNAETGGTAAQMNFKGQKMDRITMTRRELEMEIGCAEIGINILKAIGFFPVIPEVVKDREMLVCNDITACLDRVKGLGDFLELEILTEEEPLTSGQHGEESIKAKKRIEKILHKLGYTMEDTVSVSYLSMLQDKY